MQNFKNLPHDEFESQLKKIKTEVADLQRSTMTIDELETITKHPLISIQSHTINHPILTKLPDELLDFELSESQKQLEKITGKSIFAFSYPNGSISHREINAAKNIIKLHFQQSRIISRQVQICIPYHAMH